MTIEMTGADWFARATAIAGAPAIGAIVVAGAEWRAAAECLAGEGGRLLALWADDSAATPCVHAAFATLSQGLLLTLPVERGDSYPGIEDLYPAANRMQRAAAELQAVRCTDPDRRPWLVHGPQPQTYAFVRVAGEGVHEIPVGPIHAGIIEPGHFRFSVVGEKVLRLEERLGYTHKAVERRFAAMALLDGHRLAARLCGDSAVGYSWAYLQALEGMSPVAIPPRAACLRALALELERIANHLGDLGALGNDAGFAFGLTQFSRLKELLLRATELALGQRYLFDFLVPGGVAADLGAGGQQALGACLDRLAAEVPRLREIYDEHAGLRGRYVGAGAVPPALAARLGATGLAGRASGQAYDLRVDQPCAPYAQFPPHKCGAVTGDVAARVAIRFDELLDSCRLVQALAAALPPGPCRVEVAAPPAGSAAIGLIEAWRGPILVALVAGPAGSIRRCHPHDPSWQNWPVLEHAIIDNIVPDFPLINKSFNLAYSGHDL
jgi:Ni,Fe-hydrogenase III large subunit